MASTRTISLIFKGDNRSAVRAITGIAAESDRTATRVTRDNKKMAGSFAGIGESAHRIRGSVVGLAGTVGLGGLAFGIKDVIQAGIGLQASQAKVQGALKNTGIAAGGTLEKLTKVAEGLSTRGGFGTQENLQSLAQFVTATGSAAKAQRDLALATDISRRTGKDLSTTTRAIMMLENGRTTGLARLGIAVPKVTTAEDALKNARLRGHDQLLALTAAGYKFTATQKAQYALTHQITPAMLAQAKAQDALGSKQQAFTALQGKFGGQTAEFSKKTAGRISDLQHTWKNLQEQLGAGLLPVMNKVLGVVATMVGWLTKHRAVLYLVLGAIGAVTVVLTAHKIATESARAASIAFGTAQRLLAIASGEVVAGEGAATISTIALGVAMRALPILALIGLIVLLVTHWRQVGKAGLVAWKWIKTAASDTFSWIKGHWPLLAGIILAPFTGGISLIIGLFHKQLLGAAKSTVAWIGQAFSTLGNIIAAPFKFAWGIIKGIANAIVAAFQWVVGKVKGAFSFITHVPGKLLHGAGSVLHAATFGLLHNGGEVKPRYLATGGPVGTDTVPGWLSPGEYVLNRQTTAKAGVGALDRWNHGGHAPGGGENITISPGQVVVQLNARQIAEAIVHYQLKRNARGSSSLVGGGK